MNPLPLSRDENWSGRRQASRAILRPNVATLRTDETDGVRHGSRRYVQRPRRRPLGRPGTQTRTAAAAANRPTAKPRPSVSGPISAYGSPRSSLPDYPPRFPSNPGSRRPSTQNRFVPNKPVTNDPATISHVYRPFTRQQRPSIFKGSRAGTRTGRRQTLSEADTFWPLQRTLSNLSLSPLTRSSESDERPSSPFRPIEKTPQGVVRPFTSDKPPATRKPSTSFLSASPIPLPNITPDSTLRSKSESKKPVRKSESSLNGHTLDPQRPIIPAIPLSNANSRATSPAASKSQVSTQREDPLPDIDVRPPSRPIPPFSIKSVRPPPSKVLINIHPPIRQPNTPSQPIREQDTARSRPASSATTDSLASLEEHTDDTIESIAKFESPYTQHRAQGDHVIRPANQHTPRVPTASLGEIMLAEFPSSQANKLTGMDSAKPAFTIKPTPAAAAAKAADVSNSRRGSGKDIPPADVDSDDPYSKTTFTIKPMTSSTPKPQRGMSLALRKMTATEVKLSPSEKAKMEEAKAKLAMLEKEEQDIKAKLSEAEKGALGV
ncbi:hypothetical protein EGW08_015383 [Elysia chlorotica]|uniref:Uncharacterized protein n=1 Tax=Elysia chlorotica TaxID=188477 RepID=A0A433T5K1_ELYCH|nr:hypothetical protein EGW08_015383 [Elysia chlorotica]